MIASMRTEKQLSALYEAACLQELQALKPGNVHIFAAGHDMDVAHFMQSAAVSSSPLSDAQKTVGERIFAAMQATHAAVGMNTNLGIILLCAPILHAYQTLNCNDGQKVTTADLQGALHHTLTTLTIDDAALAAQAVVLAKPAGLGDSDVHDVNRSPDVSLFQMMQYAASKDRIAFQYVNQFSDVFTLGLDSYQEAMQRWHSEPWATTWVYLNYLAQMPDTHIVRKYGNSAAENVLKMAKDMQDKIRLAEHPKLLRGELIAWDSALKKNRINPGTSADLTVATLLILALI